MIIVLDSSALARGTRFEKSVAAVMSRGVRVVVPHLVVLDAAHRYRKESAEMIAALSASARMYDRLGLRRDLTRFIDAAHDKADSYVQDLVDELVGIGIEVLEPVGVSHLEIADRAMAMRRPYVDKKKRDGYIATLNWLTLLDLADRNPGAEILWVSDDTRTFGSTDDAFWHEELVGELDSRLLEHRVRWVLEFPVFDGYVPVEQVEKAPEVSEAPEVFAPVFVPPVKDTPVFDALVIAELPILEEAQFVEPRFAEPQFDETRFVDEVQLVETQPAAEVRPMKPVQRVSGTRVGPQRILPAPKAAPGGLRNLGKVIGGRRQKVTIVDDLDDVDFLDR